MTNDSLAKAWRVAWEAGMDAASDLCATRGASVTQAALARADEKGWPRRGRLKHDVSSEELAEIEAWGEACAEISAMKARGPDAD